jgi:hypothetical protein
LFSDRVITENQESSLPSWYILFRMEQNILPLDRGFRKVSELGHSPTLHKGFADFVWDLERQADRRQ